MATIEFKGINEYSKALQELGTRANGICKYAIYDAAGMVADEIKKNTPVDSGDLRDSLSLDPMKDKDGFIYTKINFVGYDSKGVPNMLKARALESGTSTMKKHPFVRPALNRVRKAAETSMEIALNAQISKIMSHFKRGL